MSQDDLEFQLSIYLERLVAWPADDVERVLAWWPTNSRWWPAWKDLQDQLPDLVFREQQLRLAHDSRAEESAIDLARRLKGKAR